MAEIKRQPQQTRNTTAKPQPVIITKKQPVTSTVLFTKDNYLWMVIGGVIVILGMLLMSGGRSDNPNVFDYNQVYSVTRVTIAPIMIIAGLMVEIYAIFRKPKASANI